MKYHEHFAAAYPIATGLIEGACRHLVRDRLECSGMRWTIKGLITELELYQPDAVRKSDRTRRELLRECFRGRASAVPLRWPRTETNSTDDGSASTIVSSTTLRVCRRLPGRLSAAIDSNLSPSDSMRGLSLSDAKTATDSDQDTGEVRGPPSFFRTFCNSLARCNNWPSCPKYFSPSMSFSVSFCLTLLPWTRRCSFGRHTQV